MLEKVFKSWLSPKSLFKCMIDHSRPVAEANPFFFHGRMIPVQNIFQGRRQQTVISKNVIFTQLPVQVRRPGVMQGNQKLIPVKRCLRLVRIKPKLPVLFSGAAFIEEVNSFGSDGYLCLSSWITREDGLALKSELVILFPTKSQAAWASVSAAEIFLSTLVIIIYSTEMARILYSNTLWMRGRCGLFEAAILTVLIKHCEPIGELEYWETWVSTLPDSGVHPTWNDHFGA